MSKPALIVGLALLAVSLGAPRGTFAQDAGKTVACSRTFDEYGALRSCDHGARLDNYAIQLTNEPRAYGYIVVYAPESASKRIAKTITDYLVEARGIPAKRLKTFHAGLNTVLTEPRIQLLIVPRGVQFEVEKSEVNLQSVKGKVAEYELLDVVDTDPGWVGWEVDESGWSIGSVTYDAIAEVLKAQKHSIAHVVGFNGSASVPGAWRRVAESTVAGMKRLGFESDRFKIGYGGQAAEDSKIQIWILPKGEAPPVKDPASEPAPSKAVEFGKFGEMELGYAKNEQMVLNRLLAVLKENPEMRACLIVRSEVPIPEEEDVEETTNPVIDLETPAEPEPELADLFKLVDKWKNELAAKHKFGPDRIVLLYSKAPLYHASSLEIWVVPPGQPLPNPDAEPEEEKPSDVVKDAERRP